MANEVAKEIKDASNQESPARIAKLKKEQEVYRWAAEVTADEIHLQLIDKIDWLSEQITNRVDQDSLAVDYAEMHSLQKALHIVE